MNSYSFQQYNYNDTIIYRKAIVAAVNPKAKPQPESNGPYKAKIVDFTDCSIGVRADGFWGEKPLYYVMPEDILSHEPKQRPSSSAQQELASGKERYYIQQVREKVFYIRERQDEQTRSSADPIVRRFLHQERNIVETCLKEMTGSQE